MLQQIMTHVVPMLLVQLAVMCVVQTVAPGSFSNAHQVETLPQIRVGMKFYSNTSLQLRNPNNLLSAGSFSKLSLYFRTDQPNGFLAYVGSDGVNTGALNTDDYMALELKDGKVVFKVDLGKGAGVVTSDKDVADGMWHHAVAERTGRNMKLVVRTADEPDSIAEGNIEGEHIVLDLDPSYTKFYVGGVPASAQLGNKVDTLRFRGCIEDVEFDGVPVGLWNFVYGENNKDGCEARDGLEVPVANGFRFDGSGYVVMAKDRFNPARETTVALNFRTYADDGLLVLMGNNENSFLAVELRDGRILFTYDLGSGKAEIMTPAGVKFSDGQWHSVSARRINKDGLVLVDGRNHYATGTSLGLQNSLHITDEIHVGGYKGTHNYPGVTSVPFRGCMKDLKLGSQVRDMNNNLFAYNVQPGCVESARSVSFVDMGSDSSYIALSNLDASGNEVSVDVAYEMTMKFKAENEDGLIFYISDDQQTQNNALSVSVVKGKVNAVATVDGTRTVLESSGNQYNDGRWHYIRVSKKNRVIQLDIDDKESFSESYEGRRRMATTSYMYFGGLPFEPLESNVGTAISYVGCIGDVTVNGNPLNFAGGDPSNMFGVNLAACPIPDQEIFPPSGGFIPPEIPQPTRPTGETDELPPYALPEQPVMPADDPNQGTRFGLAPESRWEFDTGKVLFLSDGTWQLEFKTFARDGIILYVADARQVDFVALYIKDGYVTYGYNLGDDPALISSTSMYNDGQWHTVTFTRNRLAGELVVDGTDQNSGTASGFSQYINVEMPYYVGGVTADIAQGGAANLEGLTIGLSGCLRNIQFNGNSIGDPDRPYDTAPCFSNVEPGTFFGLQGGYVQLKDNVQVHLDIDINLEIKPRTQNGVIFSIIGGEGDYLVLQIIDGQLIFSVDNGAGEFKTVWMPTLRVTLCDGEWHRITCQKARNVVTIEVDGVYGSPGTEEAGESRTDTDDPFYVGGVPVRHRGIKTVANYIGCIRNLDFGRDKPQSLREGIANGDVNLNSCWTT